MSQHPLRMERVDLLDSNKTRIVQDGKIIKARRYCYEDKNYNSIIIQEHSLGHDKAMAGRGADPHFNVRPPENEGTGYVAGTHGYYNF